MADARNRKRTTVPTAGSWKLPYVPGEVWNIPTKDECPSGEVRFKMEHTDSMFHFIKRLTALVIDLDGTIYGERVLSWPRQSGYQMEGWVSIHGSKRRVFTSSKLFEREDGSLVDVAVLILIRKDG